MTVKNHPRQSSLSSFSTAFFTPSSSTFPFTCFSSIFRRLFPKDSENHEVKLPVLRSLNFNSHFDFKIGGRFDSNLLDLWSLNFESHFDWKFGHRFTFLFAESLSN